MTNVVFSVFRISSPRRVLALAAALLALAAPGTARAQNVPGAGDADFGRARREYTADALRDFNRFTADWSAAWQSGDARELTGMYSANPTVVFSDSVLVRGQPALRAFFGRSLRPGTQLRLGIGDFVAGEDLSFGTGVFAYQASDEAEAVTGTYFIVLYKEGGRWRIRSQVFTPSLPLQAAPPA